jgi:hypothetical protein
MVDWPPFSKENENLGRSILKTPLNVNVCKGKGTMCFSNILGANLAFVT